MLAGQLHDTDAINTPSSPAEAEMVLSALEAGASAYERRRNGRRAYRVQAELQLFTDMGRPPHLLYTRDVNARGLGFITRQRLPLGYGGRVQFAGPAGQTLSIQCTLYRCRETACGWFEGALYFNREQWAFRD